MTVKTLELDPQQIARALDCDSTKAIAAFRDGRVAHPFCQHWAERSYGPGTKVHVLTARSGVQFQRSRHQGTGRQCSQQDLIESLTIEETIVVADVADFPRIVLSCPGNERLLSLAERGKLTPNGLKRQGYYQLLR